MSLLLLFDDDEDAIPAVLGFRSTGADLRRIGQGAGAAMRRVSGSGAAIKKPSGSGGVVLGLMLAGLLLRVLLLW